MIGERALQQVGEELYGGRDPALPFVDGPPLRVSSERGEKLLEIKLPYAVGDRLDLKQRGGELILTVGGWRRRLPLPESLRDCAVSSARFTGGALRIRFKAEEEP